MCADRARCDAETRAGHLRSHSQELDDQSVEQGHEDKICVAKYFLHVAATLEAPDRLPHLATLSYRIRANRLGDTQDAMDRLRLVCERRGVHLGVTTHRALRVFGAELTRQT